MREIKFRAWDIVSHFDDEEPKREMIYFELHETRKIENLSLESVEMQYTGLKDKNGVEIYEGDITKESRKRVKNERHFVVVWNNDIGSYTFKPLDKIETSYPCFNIGTIKSLEVVGNIYENPESLEG